MYGSDRHSPTPLLKLKRGAGLRRNLPVLLAACLVYGSPIIVAVGPLCLLFSTWYWLKHGSWVYFDNALILWFFDDVREWLLRPESWHGLHSVVSWAFQYLPVGLALVPLGLLSGVCGGILAANLQEE